MAIARITAELDRISLARTRACEPARASRAATATNAASWRRAEAQAQREQAAHVKAEYSLREHPALGHWLRQTSSSRRWRDHRQVINAILWKLRTGAPWRDLPDRYGPWKTAHERLRVWTADGTWERILDHVIVKDDSVGNVEWTISIDSSSIRAPRHSAGARKKTSHGFGGQAAVLMRPWSRRGTVSCRIPGWRGVGYWGVGPG